MKKKSLATRTTFGVILILAPLIFAFAIALDIYVPSIPDVRAYFGVNQLVMQLTISTFLLLTGIGQLFFGPISDQIGRRIVCLLSIAFLIVGSFICAVAFNISILIIGRMVQALGACGMMVTCFAIVRDLFNEDECAQVYSYLNSTIALSPLLAPVIGGYLAYWINWQASFVFLGLVGIIIFISSNFYINETLAPQNKRNLQKELFYDYFFVLKDPRFLIYTFCASAGFAGFLTFFSSSSYILISLLHVPEQHFGFYFATIGVFFFVGSILSGLCAQRFGIFVTVILGALLMAACGVIMVAWYDVYGLSTWEFMVPMFVMGVGGAFLMGGGAGGAISPFPEMAGTASALFGCVQFCFGFIVSQIVMEWQVKSTIPLSYTLITLGIIACLLCLVSYKKIA